MHTKKILKILGECQSLLLDQVHTMLQVCSELTRWHRRLFCCLGQTLSSAAKQGGSRQKCSMHASQPGSQVYRWRSLGSPGTMSIQCRCVFNGNKQPWKGRHWICTKQCIRNHLHTPTPQQEPERAEFTSRKRKSYQEKKRSFPSLT